MGSRCGGAVQLSAWSLRLARQILGIPSPSRAWSEVRLPVKWDSITIDGSSWPVGRFPGVFDPARVRAAYRPAPPWYAKRSPLEPYEWPELRRAARLLRRAIRRYWFALMFDPESPITTSLRVAMANRPRPPEKRTAYDEMRELLDSLERFRSVRKSSTSG